LDLREGKIAECHSLPCLLLDTNIMLGSREEDKGI
jgi:hypothetical protein